MGSTVIADSGVVVGDQSSSASAGSGIMGCQQLLDTDPSTIGPLVALLVDGWFDTWIDGPSMGERDDYTYHFGEGSFSGS